MTGLADCLGITPKAAAALSQCQAVTLTGHRCVRDATTTLCDADGTVGLCSVHAAVWKRGDLLTWGPVGWEVRTG